MTGQGRVEHEVSVSPAEGERYITVADAWVLLEELSMARVDGSAIICAQVSRGRVKRLWASDATAAEPVLSAAQDFDALAVEARQYPPPDPDTMLPAGEAERLALPAAEEPTGDTAEITAVERPVARASRRRGAHAKQ